MTRLNYSLIFIVALSTGACTQQSKQFKGKFGEIEVKEIDLASRVPSRVAKVLVTLGQKVKAGDILVELEGDIIAAQKQRAQAGVSAAKSQSDIAHDATRKEEMTQLKAKLNAATTQRDLANATLTRMKQLLKEGAVAQQKYDEIDAMARGAEDNYQASLAQYNMGHKGARVESKAAAEALVSQAQSGLSEVSALEKDLTLRAPVDGEVFGLPHEVGELVPAGYPVVTIINMSAPWVVLQIPETQLKDFTLERELNVIVPALESQSMAVKVSYIAAMPSYATLVYTQQRSSFDLKTFEVRLTPVKPLADLRPGMTVVLPN